MVFDEKEHLGIPYISIHGLAHSFSHFNNVIAVVCQVLLLQGTGKGKHKECPKDFPWSVLILQFACDGSFFQGLQSWPWLLCKKYREERDCHGKSWSRFVCAFKLQNGFFVHMGPIKKLSLFSALSIQSLISQTVLCNTPPPTLKICIIIFTNLWTMRWIALNTQKLSTVLYFGVGTIRTRRATQKLRTPIKSRPRLVEQRLAQLSVGKDQVRIVKHLKWQYACSAYYARVIHVVQGHFSNRVTNFWYFQTLLIVFGKMKPATVGMT